MSASRITDCFRIFALLASTLALISSPATAAPAACKGFKVVQSCTGGAPVTDTAACSSLSFNPEYQSCLSSHEPSWVCAPKSGNAAEYSSCLGSHNASFECGYLSGNQPYQSCLSSHTTYPPQHCSPVKVPCDQPDDIVDALSRLFQPAR